MVAQVDVGDIVQLRKKHPCGSYLWRVSRVGLDIGLVCEKCERRILIPRSVFNKRLKQVVRRTEQEDSNDSGLAE